MKKKKQRKKKYFNSKKILVKKIEKKFSIAQKTNGLLLADEELRCTSSSSADIVCRWRGKTPKKQTTPK